MFQEEGTVYEVVGYTAITNEKISLLKTECLLEAYKHVQHMEAEARVALMHDASSNYVVYKIEPCFNGQIK